MNGRETVDVGDLLGSVNTASGHCRALYLFVLLVALYVVLLGGSTTDEQLLKGSAITLPLINVGLPIVGVYVVVPPLFVLVHFNLLLQLYVLSRKVFDLDEVIATGADERRVDSFPFSQMLIGHNHPAAIKALLALIVFWAIVVIPLIVLTAVQIRFLPYHSDAISSFHAALTVIDVAMFWWFWPRMVGRRGRFGDWFEETRDRVRRWGPALVNGVLSVALVFLAVFVFVVPGGRLETWVPQLARINILDRLHWGGNRFRDLDVPEALLVREDVAAEVLAAFADKDGAAVERARARFAKGLDLRGRDLRNANLRGARLYKVDFRGEATRLEGADLSRAQLEGSKLTKAQFQGAHLLGANLQGAYLSGADLQGADLGGANLYGVDLEASDLRMVDLRFVSFEPLSEDEWQKIRDETSSNLPEGRRRNEALDRILSARIRKTSIQPKSAEDAVYNPDQPEFAYMAERWTPPSGDDELRKVGERIDGFLVSLACTDEYVARGIARRLIDGADRTAARALLDKRNAVQAKPEECQGLEGISEETWAKLQKTAGEAPSP